MIEQVNPDRAPAEDSDEEGKPVEMASWVSYFHPVTMGKIINKRMAISAPIIGIYYIIQFMCCVCACNFFSDVTRKNECLIEGSVVTDEDASKILDLPIAMAGIWHIIEWIRTTVLLTVIFIGAHQLMWVWYVTMINAFYGIACLIVVMMVYLGEKGKSCGA